MKPEHLDMATIVLRTLEVVLTLLFTWLGKRAWKFLLDREKEAERWKEFDAAMLQVLGDPKDPVNHPGVSRRLDQVEDVATSASGRINQFFSDLGISDSSPAMRAVRVKVLKHAIMGGMGGGKIESPPVSDPIESDPPPRASNTGGHRVLGASALPAPVPRPALRRGTAWRGKPDDGSDPPDDDGSDR